MDWKSLGLQCETNLQEIMSCKFSDVVRFDLGPLLQGKTKITKLKSAYNSLILVPEVWDSKPTFWKSWAQNLMVWSDFTLGPSFKVKRG